MKYTENKLLLKIGKHTFQKVLYCMPSKSPVPKLEREGWGLVCLKGEITGAPSIGAKKLWGKVGEGYGFP